LGVVLATTALTFEGVAVVAGVLEVCAGDSVAAASRLSAASHKNVIRQRFKLILTPTKKAGTENNL
jgi:hypothetical protein